MPTPTPTALDLLRRVYDFHHWRVSRAVAELAPLPDAQLDALLGGSFQSLRALVQHLVWVDQLWHARVHGRPNPALEPVAALPWRDLLATWQRQADHWQTYLAGLTPERLDQPVAYVSVTLGPFTHPLADLLFQAQDHAGYHLGQLAHAFRQVGLTPAPTGYAAWLWR